MIKYTYEYHKCSIVKNINRKFYNDHIFTNASYVNHQIVTLLLDVYVLNINP